MGGSFLLMPLVGPESSKGRGVAEGCVCVSE